MRLNLGCGMFALPGFTNLDSSADSRADLLADVPPLPFLDGSAGEVWASHVLEHLDQPRAAELLRECWRVLRPGGMIGVVVPDTRAIMRRWLDGPATMVQAPLGQFWDTSDLDDMAALFIYSTVQESRHQWAYDGATLRRALTRAGFVVTVEIDRERDPRLGKGAWYQCGLTATKPEELY